MAGLNAGKRFGKCFGKCHTLGCGVSLEFAAVPEVMVPAVSSLMLQLMVARSLAVPDPSLGAQVTHEPERGSSTQSHQNCLYCSRTLEKVWKTTTWGCDGHLSALSHPSLGFGGSLFWAVSGSPPQFQSLCPRSCHHSSGSSRFLTSRRAGT